MIDLAYYGLGDGLEEDASLAKQLLDMADAGAVAVACSKAFGLYGERTGALLVKSPHTQI